MRKKYRIARIKTITAFGDPVYRYAVQVRIALFWWVTIVTCDHLSQARYCLNESGVVNRPVEVIKIVSRYPKNSTKS